MGTTTGNSAQGHAFQPTKGRDEMPDLDANLMKYSLVMSFADRLLERGVLTPKEYTDFSVETAQIFAIKMPQNPLISHADNPSNPRHNDGWNL